MANNSLILTKDSRIAIVGGGPAGSLCAMYLLQYGLECGIRTEITIYQQRDFSGLGQKGCKGCAGILSSSFVNNSADLRLTVPSEIVQSRIDQYSVHSAFTSITLSNPEKGKHIHSIYRGGGPRISNYEQPISFDGWLLREAESRGVKVRQQVVTGIYIGPDEAGLELGDSRQTFNLVVLAAGVNGKPVPVHGYPYVMPETQTMAQDELYAGEEQVKACLGNTAHVFLVPNSGLVFGSLVPKGPFINVSVLSDRKHHISVADFLSYPMVRNVLPERYSRACGCRPKIVVGLARNYYADRFVAIGDSAVCRLYKDGIGSSLLMARRAAHTAVYSSVSGKDFERFYAPLVRRLHQDNRWGRVLFWMNEKGKDSRSFLLAQHSVLSGEQNNTTGPTPYTKVMWGMFTGSYSYTSMARMTFGSLSQAKLGILYVYQALKGLFRKGRDAHRTLLVRSRKVLILGSGFGGTYTLRHLLRSLNKNENVETTIVSDENFFLFSPLLHEVAMGGIETRHIAYPVRRTHWRDRFNFVHAGVEKIDIKNHKVYTSEGTLDYDYLVLALGSITDTSELRSNSNNVFTLKTLHDSMLIRNHIIGVFEKACIERDLERQKQLLTFVVAGGGYTGVQLAAEMRGLVSGNLTKFYKGINKEFIRIILVQAEGNVVAGMNPKVVSYAGRRLRRMGIEVRLNSRVTRVHEDGIEINGVEIVPTGTIIWVAGVVACPRVAELDLKKDEIGRACVDEYLNVIGAPQVYAVGDCAHYEDPKTHLPIPPRAHTAVRQAKTAARNILADIRGVDKKPYHYTDSAGTLSLGSSDAVIRLYGIHLYGFMARVLWLLGYLALVTGVYNRVRIMQDWVLSGFFGRDTTYLSITRPVIREEARRPSEVR